MPKVQKREQHVKAAVRSADPNMLAKLVLDLSELNDENLAFVEARLGLGEDSLLPYKQRIQDALYPGFDQPIRIAEARRAVTEYRKAAGDPSGLLELMIHYVECGTECTVNYGDIDEPFYNSLESMYDRFLTALDKAGPTVKESFRERAERVVGRAQGIGWGYYDFLADRFDRAFPE
jgi:hypothetical protein